MSRLGLLICGALLLGGASFALSGCGTTGYVEEDNVYGYAGPYPDGFYGHPGYYGGETVIVNAPYGRDRDDHRSDDHRSDDHRPPEAGPAARPESHPAPRAMPGIPNAPRPSRSILAPSRGAGPAPSSDRERH